MSRSTSARRGYTLIEVAMAGGLTAATIVPALVLMRDSIETGWEIEAQQMCTTLAVRKMEEGTARVTANFEAVGEVGDFASEGYADYRYVLWSSTSALYGGQPDRVMVVATYVWYDADSNDIFNAGEEIYLIATKVANLALYKDKANG